MGNGGGRFWLDVVRYADSSGFEFDIDVTNAWRYRDYVIRAFNTDKPYDQFVIEQLAGDELDHPTEDSLIGTTYYQSRSPRAVSGEKLSLLPLRLHGRHDPDDVSGLHGPVGQLRALRDHQVRSNHAAGLLQVGGDVKGLRRLRSTLGIEGTGPGIRAHQEE